MIKDPTLPWDVCLSRFPLSGDAIAPSECGFWSSTNHFGFSVLAIECAYRLPSLHQGKKIIPRPTRIDDWQSWYPTIDPVPACIECKR